ncbi:sensor histidine kinase [Actinoplanes subtropicus]|uniref:sensor histidine kinase n=1 Tax=Actinoplanes subtropicus TaxID=543632 RepID=UPI0004C45A4E|nr:histidine kinase [Actinoplanes subtropicus]
MGWVVRLFERRQTWLRMLLLDLSGVAYLVFGPHDPGLPDARQWQLAVLAFGCAIALGRWPLVNFLAQTGLLTIAICVLPDETINRVGASWALVEVALWTARPLTIWLCTALLFAVYLVFGLPGSDGPVSTEIFGILLLPVGLPLLLGLVIRNTRELGRQAQLWAESEGRAARADERGAIARELHDVVAHHVASMVLRAGVARHVLPELDPRVAEVLDDVHATGTTALTDLRRLVEVLRDPAGVRDDAAITAIEPGSLPAALGAAVDTARRTGLSVEADIDEAVGTIDAVRGLAVLRLTQEALTNVAKHAGPTARARLRVTVDDDAVSWEVTDDGGAAGNEGDAVGLPPQGAWFSAPSVGPGAGSGPAGGHGLVGMRERVEVLGGELTAGPDGSGWRVGTVLPR